MKNVVYIKETRKEDRTEFEVYTTLVHVLREMGLENRYMTAYNILTKGKPFVYGNITIKRTTIKHNSQNERRKV